MNVALHGIVTVNEEKTTHPHSPYLPKSKPRCQTWRLKCLEGVTTHPVILFASNWSYLGSSGSWANLSMQLTSL